MSHSTAEPKMYDVEVTRDGDWFMVAIPELDGLTQCRGIGEASIVAREWIALHLGVPLGQVGVNVNSDYTG